MACGGHYRSLTVAGQWRICTAFPYIRQPTLWSTFHQQDGGSYRFLPYFGWKTNCLSAEGYQNGSTRKMEADWSVRSSVLPSKPKQAGVLGRSPDSCFSGLTAFPPRLAGAVAVLVSPTQLQWRGRAGFAPDFPIFRTMPRTSPIMSELPQPVKRERLGVSVAINERPAEISSV